MGSGGIAPRVLNFGTRWRWVVSFTLRPHYPRRSPQYPSDRRLRRPQSRLRSGCEKNKSLSLPGVAPRSPSPQT